MKDEETRFVRHASSLIPHPSSLVLGPFLNLWTAPGVVGMICAVDAADRHHPSTDLSLSFTMSYRYLAATLLALFLAGCSGDATTPSELDEDQAGTDAKQGVPASAAQVACPACTFEPRLFTRRTGTPVTEVVQFPGNPAGAYIIEISDLGTQGANASVELNGRPLNVRSGQLRQEIIVDWQNTLHIRLTGKPGSQLSVRVFQEIASVTVTPGAPRSRIGNPLQFTAVAKDRNGVAIPRQTFTWESRNATIATIHVTSGQATTTGPVHSTAPWRYKTISTGEGAVAIIAHADGAPGKNGMATWTVVAGFVYSTFRAPLPLDSPDRAGRSEPEAIRYDVARLQSMAGICASETGNTAWRPLGTGERQFKQCYPELEHATPTRQWIPPTPFTPGFYRFGTDNNVGLYGRYCGGGQPDGEWMAFARAPGYQPKDPIDGMCMEHDRSLENHELDPVTNAAATGCILRYGIETETLYEEGVRVPAGSARWNAFWNAWPAMAEAREHWIAESKRICFGPIYNGFLSDRGLL
jgi:hypothetical protein